MNIRQSFALMWSGGIGVPVESELNQIDSLYAPAYTDTSTHSSSTSSMIYICFEN